MLLPLYYTAQCDPLRVGRITCEEHSQNTDFERLTIMNVVADYYTDIVFSNGTTTTQEQSMDASYRNESTINFIDYDLLRTMTWTWTLGVTGECLCLFLFLFVEETKINNAQHYSLTPYGLHFIFLFLLFFLLHRTLSCICRYYYFDHYIYMLYVILLFLFLPLSFLEMYFFY